MRLQPIAKLLTPAVGLDLLRIYLGFALFVRGAIFISRPDALMTYMQRTGQWFMPLVITHYVVAAHLAGGLLLTLGLCTRLAAVAQAPILLGAVLYVHWREGLLSAGQSLELSALVLVMLVVIGACGAGELSVDHLLAKNVEPQAMHTPSSPPALEHEHEAPAHT
jgi:putative oxidoreductase